MKWEEAVNKSPVSLAIRMVQPDSGANGSYRLVNAAGDVFKFDGEQINSIYNMSKTQSLRYEDFVPFSVNSISGMTDILINAISGLCSGTKAKPTATRLSTIVQMAETHLNQMEQEMNALRVKDFTNPSYAERLDQIINHAKALKELL